MMLQEFKNSFNFCVGQPSKYPSEYFKKFVDRLLPQKSLDNPLRTAMITGYFLRCAEGGVGQLSPKALTQPIQEIISSSKREEDKIESIANYLDNHNRIGLSGEVANYSLIPFQNTQDYFEVYAKDFITQVLSQRQLSKEKEETFQEVVYRNMAFGYLYRLAEDLIKN